MDSGFLAAARQSWGSTRSDQSEASLSPLTLREKRRELSEVGHLGEGKIWQTDGLIMVVLFFLSLPGGP